MRDRSARVSRETPSAPDSLELRADGLNADYGRRPVLHGINLTIRPGKITVLAGPNASGKSTLLKCLAGILRPSAGTVHLGPYDLQHCRPAQVARHVAAVPQDNPMPFDFTVREMVALGANAPAGETARRAPADQRIEDAIREMDLNDIPRRSVATLSGGERQRAAIARALAQDTPCLLLDEPTAHLDPRHQNLLFAALFRRARAEGKTILLVLHDLNAALAIADRIILMREGRVAASGPRDQVLDEDTLQSVYGIALKRIHAMTGEQAITLPAVDRAA